MDHENRLLLQKMSRIMKEPALVDSWNDYQSKRLMASFTIWYTCTWTESILQNGFSLQCKLRLWSSFVLFYWLSWFCFMVVIWNQAPGAWCPCSLGISWCRPIMDIDGEHVSSKYIYQRQRWAMFASTETHFLM